MKLHIFTIVYNGMPFIERQLPIFDKLQSDWRWHVVEGPAANTHCTHWCRPPRLHEKDDGTGSYVNTLARHPRVKTYRKEIWDGKIEMVNAPLAAIQEPCLLMEIDVDEFWTPEQIDLLVSMADAGDWDRAEFFCRYFVGHNIVILSENTYGNRLGEWRRAWKFKPGFKFKRHEPPEMFNHATQKVLRREETRERGLVFDHYAYVEESQVRFKEYYYKYPGALVQWRRLQANTQWPARLRGYLPWVRDNAIATRLTQ